VAKDRCRISVIVKRTCTNWTVLVDTCQMCVGQVAPKIVSPRTRNPYFEEINIIVGSWIFSSESSDRVLDPTILLVLIRRSCNREYHLFLFLQNRRIW
jgi:hypothetical protein